MRLVNASTVMGATITTALPETVRDCAGSTQQVVLPPPGRRLQLDYIDGLRGLAALYIVVHHVLMTTGPPSSSLPVRAFSFGQEVVAMFLTISGFCLALPHAMKSDWTVNAGRFYLRRAWRILPPYYAALTLGIAVTALRTRWGVPFPIVAVVQHLLLVHNWSPENMFQLNGPLWSVALECQIYLLFPLLLLLRRQMGMVIMLALATLVAFVSFHLLGGVGQTHFLAFFVIGIFFAQVAFKPQYRRWLAWGMMAGAAGFAAGEFYREHVAQEFCAIFIGSLLAYLLGSNRHPVRRLLSWAPLAFVGTFSYSIYLAHGILFEAVYDQIHARDASFGVHNDLRHLAIMGSTALLSILFAYAFHRVVELPFMSVPRKAAEDRLSPGEGRSYQPRQNCIARALQFAGHGFTAGKEDRPSSKWMGEALQRSATRSRTIAKPQAAWRDAGPT